MTITLNGTTGIVGPNGTASVPAMTGVDTDSGIVYGTNTVQIATGGATAVTVDSSQNVGIGVTSPLAKLHVRTSSTGSTAQGIMLDAGAQQHSWYLSDNTTSTFEVGSSAGTWRWVNSGGERMRIDSSGNLLVGTTSNPNTARMYVRYDTISTQININSATTTAASTSWSHFAGQSGNGSSITTNNIFIYGNGNIQNANNSYGAISDIKLKENIVDATPKLEDLCKVKIRQYNLIGDYEKHKQLGVVAQELEQVFPAMVEENADKDFEGNDLGTTTKSVKYSVFVPMLIKAIQELNAKVTALEAQLGAK